MTDYCKATGKVVYANRAEARDAVKRMQRGTRRTLTLVVYKCAGCGKYHLGDIHQRKRAK